MWTTRRRRRSRWPAASTVMAAAIVVAASAADEPPRTSHDGTHQDGRVRAPLDQAATPADLDGASSMPAGDMESAVPVGQGIPEPVLGAYQRATGALGASQPGCRLPLALLAAIGKVETGHARGGQVDARGRTLRPILGPALDGTGGLAAIPDTDRGRYDSDTRWDRAVGPMQIIPGTWANWAADGNADRATDPHNIHDASLSAARYLCAGERDLSTADGVRDAILSYNYSASYLTAVLAWMSAYSNGTIAVPAQPIDDAPRTAESAPVLARPAARTPTPPAAAGPTPIAPPRPDPAPLPTTPSARPLELLPALACAVDDLLDQSTGLPGTLLGRPANGTTEEEAGATSPCAP